jgi:hypothetical protein
VFANASSLGDGGHAIIDVVARGMVRLGLQAERLCGFGKYVLVVAIEEGYDRAFTVQS